MAVVVRQQDGTVEAVIAAIASRQHGVAARRQLLRAGVTEAEIRHRLRTGALLLEYPGTYRVGHRAPSDEARYIAAVLGCGDEAFLSYLAAAHLLRLTRAAAVHPEVTGPTKRRLRGVRTHRARRTDPHDVTTVSGIRVTTVPRTLVDIAARLDLDPLARACHEAGVRYRTTPRQVEAVLARRPTSPGAAKLRAVMSGEVRVSLSELERRFLALLREAGLPLPQTNRRTGSFRLDCRWPEYHLTVELDSYRFHNTRKSWEDDHLREREARGRGDDYRRYTYADVFEDPRAMLAELRVALAEPKVAA